MKDGDYYGIDDATEGRVPLGKRYAVAFNDCCGGVRFTSALLEIRKIEDGDDPDGDMNLGDTLLSFNNGVKISVTRGLQLRPV